MMDNPNNATRIRRFNSFPSLVRRRSSLWPLQLRMKTNPYVGSFRHSPPTTFRSMEAGMFNERHKDDPQDNGQLPMSEQSPMRSSPYVGWFRHAPASTVTVYKVDQLNLRHFNEYQVIAEILERIPPPVRSRPSFAHIIDGRLRGGGRDDKGYQMRRWEEHRDLASPTNASATINLLAKVSSWLFGLDTKGYGDNDTRFSPNYKLLTDSQKHEDSDCGSESGSEDAPDTNSIYSDEDDDSSIALSDFDGPVVNDATSHSGTPLDVSVSEIAEAYYAHQSVDQGEYSALEGDRLDYVITQADIARMARNAARHLDVDSILNLPTVTYRSPKTPNTSKEQSQSVADSRGPDEAWSFIVIPQSDSKTLKQVVPKDGGAPDALCVICLQKFVDGDRLRVLPCDHSFHVGCIDRWLSGSHSYNECFTSGCPTCKARPADTTPTLDPHSTNEIIDNDGSVPSWAFAKLGAELARSCSD